MRSGFAVGMGLARAGVSRIVKSTPWRRWGTGALAFAAAGLVGACAGGNGARPAKPASECADAQRLVDRARALRAEGRLERAERTLKRAAASCRKPEADRMLAETTAELDAKEPGATLAARGAKLRAAGDEVGARKAFDRALRAFEREQRSTARVLERDDTPRPLGQAPWSAKGRWLSIDGVVLEANTGAVKIDGAEDVAFSPDERLAAFDDANGFTVREIASGRDVHTFAARPSSAKFDPSSKRLLWIADEQTTHLVDLETKRDVVLGDDIDDPRFRDDGRWVAWRAHGKLAWRDIVTGTSMERDVGADTAGDLAFANDRLVAWHGADVVVLGLTDGREQMRIRSVESWALSADKRRLAWSPLGSQGMKVSVEDVETKRHVAAKVRFPRDGTGNYAGVCGGGTFRVESLTNDALVMHRDCSLLDVVVLDIAKGTVIGTEGHTPAEDYDEQQQIEGTCRSAGTSCENATGAARSGDRVVAPFPTELRVVQVDTGKTIAPLQDSRLQALEYGDLSFSPGGDRLAGVDASGRGRVWDVRTGKRLWAGPLRPERVLAAAIDGERIVTTAKGTLRIWDAGAHTLRATRDLGGCVPELLASRGNGGVVVACPRGDTIAFLDEEGRELKSMPRVDQGTHFVLDAEGNGYAIASGAHVVVGAFASKKSSTIDLGKGATLGLVALRGRRLATVVSGRSGTLLQLWDVDSGATTYTTEIKSGPYSLAVTSDGALVTYYAEAQLVSASGKKATHAWKNRLQLLSPSPSGATFAAVDQAGGLSILRASSFEAEPLVLAGVRDTGLAVISRDESQLATRNPSGTMRVAGFDGADGWTYAAAPFARDGAVFSAEWGARLQGDLGAARGLLRCAIGAEIVPFDVCEDRAAEE